MGSDDERNTAPSSPAEEAELGRRIRRSRLERGLTLRQLEELADLSATHLSDIERGQTSPTLGALMRVAAALGRDPAYFVDPEGRTDVHYHPVEACRTSTPVPGVTVEILTLGIPSSRMLAYRLRTGDGVSQALLVSCRALNAEVVYLVWLGSAEIEAGHGTVPLGTGDALQTSFERSHRLRAVDEGPSEVILVATHALRFAATP